MQLDVVASSMHVASYEDLNMLEKEVARLLQCSASRAPACLAAESYQRFRQAVLCTIFQQQQHLGPDHLFHLGSGTLPLEQGLFIRAPNSCHPLFIQLVWREACCPAAPSEIKLTATSAAAPGRGLLKSRDFSQ